jgi:hypothetical protein
LLIQQQQQQQQQHQQRNNNSISSIKQQQQQQQVKGNILLERFYLKKMGNKKNGEFFDFIYLLRHFNCFI